MANAFIPLVDFTDSNGSTRVVPGTHRVRSIPRVQPRRHHPQERRLVGRAGSAFIVNGHLWHSGTLNESASPRHALHLSFARRGVRGLYEAAKPIVPAWAGAEARRLLAQRPLGDSRRLASAAVGSISAGALAPNPNAGGGKVIRVDKAALEVPEGALDEELELTIHSEPPAPGPGAFSPTAGGPVPHEAGGGRLRRAALAGGRSPAGTSLGFGSGGGAISGFGARVGLQIRSLSPHDAVSPSAGPGPVPRRSLSVGC